MLSSKVYKFVASFCLVILSDTNFTSNLVKKLNRFVYYHQLMAYKSVRPQTSHLEVKSATYVLLT